MAGQRGWRADLLNSVLGGLGLTTKAPKSTRRFFLLPWLVEARFVTRLLVLLALLLLIIMPPSWLLFCMKRMTHTWFISGRPATGVFSAH